MNWQSGLFVRTKLRPKGALRSTNPRDDTELGRMVQTVVDSLNSEIGILSRNGFDEMAPTIVASTGMPCPGFALTAIADIVEQQRTHELNGLNGRHNIIGNNIAELTISEDKEGKPYCLMQMAMADDEENIFILTVGRPTKNGHFSPEEKRMAAGLFSVFFEYIKEAQNSLTSGEPMDCLICALELWDIGIMLIDHRSEIIFSNGAANAILDEGNGLKRIGHNLTANRLDDTARLQSAILFSLQTSPEERIKIDRPKVPVVAIERHSNRRPLIVSVAPITPLTSPSRQPAAVIYIVDPDRDMHDSISAICQTYGLTNVEAELASNLVMGLTIVQTAKKMHIQVNTARSYLKQVFQKTMTNRQADLVRIILTSSFNPVKNLRLSPL